MSPLSAAADSILDEIERLLSQNLRSKPDRQQTAPMRSIRFHYHSCSQLDEAAGDIHPKLLAAVIAFGIEMKNTLGNEPLAFLAVLTIDPQRHRPKLLFPRYSQDDTHRAAKARIQIWKASSRLNSMYRMARSRFMIDVSARLTVDEFLKLADLLIQPRKH